MLCCSGGTTSPGKLCPNLESARETFSRGKRLAHRLLESERRHRAASHTKNYLEPGEMFALTFPISNHLSKILFCPWRIFKVRLQIFTQLKSQPSTRANMFPQRTTSCPVIHMVTLCICITAPHSKPLSWVKIRKQKGHASLGIHRPCRALVHTFSLLVF